MIDRRPHLVLVLARGETVRNFVYSDTLPVLSENARLTLLTAITDESIIGPYRDRFDRVVPLVDHRERGLVADFRYLLHMAHVRWMWTEASKYHWAADVDRAESPARKAKLLLLKAISRPLAFRPLLERLSSLEEALSWRLRPTRDFEQLYQALQPDLVFNGSHIHGPLADLPMRVAYRQGWPTVAFLFSWDNLWSRSRIFVPYHHYLAWTEHIRRRFFELYPRVDHSRVLVTGTPQFDFHFRSDLGWSREELCRRMGLDPARPYVLYTTGYCKDFLDEHKIVEGLIQFLRELDLKPRPQLLVRTYLKGNSPEMEELGRRGDPDVVFPQVHWETTWMTPLQEDLLVYTNQLRHCALGVNAASTVTLELMMHDKPVVNLGFEPPGSRLPRHNQFSRHIGYEHYRPVAESGGVMVARSMDDLREMIRRGLTHPEADREARQRFLRWMFGDTLDGHGGRRIAETLLKLAERGRG